MLEFYLSTVVIWMIIIFCLTFIFKESIKKNWYGQINKKKSIVSGFGALFAISAVPILRFLIVIMIVYMATHTKEEFEKFCKK